MSHGLIKFSVIHSRKKPKPYTFTHKFFWFKLDLNELSHFDSPFVSYNSRNCYSFYDKDHLKLGPETAKENYILFAKQHGVDSEIVSVTLYTQLRCLGYVFNPVSFILLKDINEKEYAIIEIGNTFNEMKAYFVGNEHFGKDGFRFTTKKFFYISPFVDHDNEMTFRMIKRDSNIIIHIDDKKDDKTVLQVLFTGKEKVLNPLNLFWFSLLSPLVTLQFIFFIHLHALFLWLKRIPYFKKDEFQELQKGVQTWKI